MVSDGFVAQYVDAAFHGAEFALGHELLHVTIDLDRPYSMADLEEAAKQTERTFPVLGCHFETHWWRDRWTPSDGSPEVEDLEAEAGFEAAMNDIVRGPVDATSQRPWRVTQLRAPDASRLVVTVSHMLADAAGALTVVREFAAHLEGTEPQPSWSPRTMDRGMGQLLRALRLRDLPILAWEILLFLLLPVQLFGLAKPEPRWPSNLTGAGRQNFRTLAIDVGEGSPLRERCRGLGCTVNDALVALMGQLTGSLFGPGRIANFFTINLRPYLRDQLPRVANISGIDIVVLPRSAVGAFDSTAAEVSRRISHKKRRFTGLVAILSNLAPMSVLPHGLARLAIRVWCRWMLALTDRGIIATNIGALDPYLAPFGDRAIGASIVGPFIQGFTLPVITASGFRDRLTLQINGFDGPAGRQLDLIAARLGELMAGLEADVR